MLDSAAVSNNALTEREEESLNAGSYGSERSQCGEDKGRCEQICDDTSGTATCLCYRGYVLAQDGTTCTGLKFLIIKEDYNQPPKIAVSVTVLKRIQNSSTRRVVLL